MRSRRVVLNTVALTGGQLLTRFSGLIFVPLVAHRLGSAELGAYQLAQLLISYASVVALFGLTPLAVRLVAQEPSSGPRVFAEVLGLRLGLAVACALALLVALPALGYPPAVLLLTAVLSVNLFSYALQDSADVLFQAHERMYYSILLGIGATLVYLALGLAALALGGGTLALAVTHVISHLVRDLATLALLAVRFFRPRLALRWGAQRALLVAGFPFFVQALNVLVLNRVDVVLLSALQPLQVVGWYVASYLFLDGASYLPYGFSQAIYPGLARSAREHGLAEVTERALRLLLVATLPIPGLVALAAPGLVRLLYGAAFGPATLSVQLLIWSIVPVAYAVVVGRAILASGGQRPLTVIAIAGALLNLAANLVLIPRLSLYGAAASTLLTFVALAVAHSAVAGRFGCAPRLGSSAPYLLAAGAAWAVAAVAIPQLGWLAGALLGAAAYLPGALLVTLARGPARGPRAAVRDLFALAARPAAASHAGPADAP